MERDDRSFHRQQRMDAIARWSVVGAQEPRPPLPIEAAFTERVLKSHHPIFKPLELGDSDDPNFHRQVSYLVDAFDCLPGRVDVAFDSTWKAFESASLEVTSGNITERLAKLGAGRLDSEILTELLLSVPVQTCEYLFKRLVTDAPPASSLDYIQHQPKRRLRMLQDVDFDGLLAELQKRY